MASLKVDSAAGSVEEVTTQAEETTKMSPTAEEETVFSPVGQDIVTPPTELEAMETKEAVLVSDEEEEKEPAEEEKLEAWPTAAPAGSCVEKSCGCGATKLIEKEEEEEEDNE